MKKEDDEIHCTGKDVEGSGFDKFPNTIPGFV
jgi:hypothetical protein